MAGPGRGQRRCGRKGAEEAKGSWLVLPGAAAAAVGASELRRGVSEREGPACPCGPHGGRWPRPAWRGHPEVPGRGWAPAALHGGRGAAVVAVATAVSMGTELGGLFMSSWWLWLTRARRRTGHPRPGLPLPSAQVRPGGLPGLPALAHARSSLLLPSPSACFLGVGHFC